MDGKSRLGHKSHLQSVRARDRRDRQFHQPSRRQGRRAACKSQSRRSAARVRRARDTRARRYSRRMDRYYRTAHRTRPDGSRPGRDRGKREASRRRGRNSGRSHTGTGIRPSPRLSKPSRPAGLSSHRTKSSASPRDNLRSGSRDMLHLRMERPRHRFRTLLPRASHRPPGGAYRRAANNPRPSCKRCCRR
jgi:hypothetical protein